MLLRHVAGQCHALPQARRGFRAVAAAVPAALRAVPTQVAPAAVAPGLVVARRGFSAEIYTQTVKDFGAESITEGTVVDILKKVGAAVAKGELVASIETDKVTVDVNSEVDGAIKEWLVQAEDNVTVGQALFKAEVGAAGAVAAAPEAAAAAAAPAAVVTPAGGDPASGLTGIRAGLVRARAAREAFAAGLPPPGAAPPAAVAPTVSAAPAAAAAAPLTPTEPTPGARTERRAPISPMRWRVIQRQKDSQNTMALLTTFQEVDMSAALELRAKHQDLFKKVYGVPLGLLSLFTKACAAGLMEIPGVNGSIDDTSLEIIYRKYADISIPIPSPRGPVSCVLRNAESMSISDMEQNIAALSASALLGTLRPEDLSPASFGIADTGVAGSMLSTSLVNPPASAVLGTNAIQQRAVMVGGKVVARPSMYVSLTYDHRLVDGREAVTFLAGVRDKMEDPSRLLLGI